MANLCCFLCYVTGVDWSNKNLRNRKVINKLQRLTGFVWELHLSYNHLTKIPLLGGHSQLDMVQELNLKSNRIVTFVWDNVPTHVLKLYLNFNQLGSGDAPT